jgi:hypothetical protein
VVGQVLAMAVGHEGGVASVQDGGRRHPLAGH